MSKKTTIYIPDKPEQILAAFGCDSTSGALATIVERYDRITRESIPELTEAEWSAIADVLNGCGTLLASGGHDQAQSVWAEIADSEPDGLNEKWGISCRDLSEKLRALPLVGRIAVWDVAARFWASSQLNKMSSTDLLRECGAKISK